MRKLKVYLDTSVVSHLLQEDVLEKMADTRRLWEMFKAGKFESSSARFLRFAHIGFLEGGNADKIGVSAFFFLGV